MQRAKEEFFTVKKINFDLLRMFDLPNNNKAFIRHVRVIKITEKIIIKQMTAKGEVRSQ